MLSNAFNSTQQQQNKHRQQNTLNHTTLSSAMNHPGSSNAAITQNTEMSSSTSSIMLNQPNCNTQNQSQVALSAEPSTTEISKSFSEHDTAVASANNNSAKHACHNSDSNITSATVSGPSAAAQPIHAKKTGLACTTADTGASTSAAATPNSMLPCPRRKKSELIIYAPIIIERLFGCGPSAPYGFNVPLKSFLHTIMARTRISSHTLVTAFLYLTRLKSLHPRSRGNEGSAHRLLLAAIIVAAKYIYDDTFDNTAWATVSSGIFELKEVNNMEMEFLVFIEYTLYVTTNEWLEFYIMIDNDMKRVMDIHKTLLLVGSVNHATDRESVNDEDKGVPKQNHTHNVTGAAETSSDPAINSSSTNTTLSDTALGAQPSEYASKGLTSSHASSAMTPIAPATLIEGNQTAHQQDPKTFQRFSIAGYPLMTPPVPLEPPAQPTSYRANHPLRPYQQPLNRFNQHSNALQHPQSVSTSPINSQSIGERAGVPQPSDAHPNNPHHATNSVAQSQDFVNNIGSVPSHPIQHKNMQNHPSMMDSASNRGMPMQQDQHLYTCSIPPSAQQMQPMMQPPRPQAPQNFSSMAQSSTAPMMNDQQRSFNQYPYHRSTGPIDLNHYQQQMAQQRQQYHQQAQMQDQYMNSYMPPQRPQVYSNMYHQGMQQPQDQQHGYASDRRTNFHQQQQLSRPMQQQQIYHGPQMHQQQQFPQSHHPMNTHTQQNFSAQQQYQYQHKHQQNQYPTNHVNTMQPMQQQMMFPPMQSIATNSGPNTKNSYMKNPSPSPMDSQSGSSAPITHQQLPQHIPSVSFSLQRLQSPAQSHHMQQEHPDMMSGQNMQYQRPSAGGPSTFTPTPPPLQQHDMSASLKPPQFHHQKSFDQMQTQQSMHQQQQQGYPNGGIPHTNIANHGGLAAFVSPPVTTATPISGQITPTMLSSATGISNATPSGPYPKSAFVNNVASASTLSHPMAPTQPQRQPQHTADMQQ